MEIDVYLNVGTLDSGKWTVSATMISKQPRRYQTLAFSLPPREFDQRALALAYARDRVADYLAAHYPKATIRTVVRDL